MNTNAPSPVPMRVARGQRLLAVFAVAAIAFGALTVVSGAVALFGGGRVRELVGDAVPVVLWFNFLAGWVYVLAGVGLLGRRRWGALLALALASSTLAVGLVFGVHVLQGGAYEARTVWALAFRTLFWIVVAALSVPALRRR